MAMNDSKFQAGDAPAPQGLQGDVIISPDTLREDRIPPRQARTRKWPVLDASGPPEIALDQWTFKIQGLVDTPVTWTWREFQALPRVRVFSDFHCVTRWSRLGNLWEGVRTSELLKHVQHLASNAFRSGLGSRLGLDYEHAAGSFSSRGRTFRGYS